MALQVVKDVEAVFVTAAGLVLRSRTNGESTETAHWRHAPVPAWAQAGWVPEPTRCAISSIGSVNAALVAHGEAWSLGVSFGDDITWHRVSRDDDEARRLLLGKAIGRLGERIDIDAMANSRYTPPVIHRARLIQRTVTSHSVSSDGAPDKKAFREIAESWSLISAVPRHAEGGLPSALVDALVELDPLPPAEPQGIVSIALTVVEQWENPHGRRTVHY